MGRLVSYDHTVQDQLQEIIKSKILQSGLVVGQITNQKDIAVRLCPSPKKEDDPNLEDNKKDSKKKKPKDSTPLDLDESWICQHAKQLLRTLPGGFDILGLYVVAPSDNSIKHQAHLRQVLFSIYKTLGKSRELLLSSDERILLTICPTSSKIVCRTFDVSDYKSSAVPADWKFQTGLTKWLRLRCQLAVDAKYPFKTEDSGLNLKKQIELGLSSFLQSVSNAHTLINGTFRDPDSLLDLSADSKRSKKKQGDADERSKQCQWNDVDVFIPLNKQNSESANIFDCSCMMAFKGSVQSRAYVHGKATVKEAINALKQDMIRTIVARYEIHCEDLLLIEEEQQDPLLVHELPRRVFAPLPQGDICVCDYQFHSDTAADSLNAFKELLDLDLVEEDIDTTCEVSPTTSTLILPEVMEDRLSEFGDAQIHSSMNTYIPIIGIAATAAVGAFSYFLSVKYS